MKNINIIAGSLISLMMINSSAFATDEENLAIGNVSVTASRSDTKLEAMPQHTTVITENEIKNSSAQTIDQLLRNVPGVFIPGQPFYLSDFTGQSVTTRGVSKTTLVLVDGIPVHDPFWLSAVQWYKIPLSSVERVEIVRGGTTIWGNMASSGVINIITKVPTDSDGYAKVSGGSFSTYTGSASKNIIISDSLKINISGQSFTSNGYNTSLPSYRAGYYPGRSDSSADSQNVRLTAYFKPSDNLKGFLKLGFDRMNQDVGGYQYGDNLQKSPDIQLGVTKYFDKHDKLDINLWSQWVDLNKSNGTGCYTAPTNNTSGKTYCTGSTANPNITVPTFQYVSSTEKNNYKEQGASILFDKDNFAEKISNINLGFDFRRVSGDDIVTLYAQPTVNAGATINGTIPYPLPSASAPGPYITLDSAQQGLLSSNVFATFNNKGQQNFYALFSQIKYNPIDPIEITAGLRYDYYLNSNGATVVKFPNSTKSDLGGNSDASAKGAVNPSIAGRYDFNDNLAFRAATFKTFRAPGLNELYRSYTGTGTASIANPNLSAQTLLGKEIGIDWKDRTYSFSATLFENKIDDFIGKYTITKGSPISSVPAAVASFCGAEGSNLSQALCSGTISFNSNGQDMISRGVELDAKVTLNEKLSVGGYYTYTEAHYTAVRGSGNTNPVGAQLAGTPRNVLGVGFNWKPIPNLSTSMDVRAVSRYVLGYSSSTIGLPVLPQPGYAIVNLNANYQLAKDWNAFASVNNLFDKAYVENATTSGYSQSLSMPRTVTLGMRVDF